MEIRGHELQNFAENCRLSKKQEHAITELLKPSNRSLEEVADKAAVSVRTLHYWLRQSHFRERLEQERRRLRDGAFNRLRDILNKSVEGLEKLLDDENSNVKLKACQAVLDFNFRIIEVEELEKRLEKLEALNK